MTALQTETATSPKPTKSNRVSALVVGGGFAGLETAIALSKGGLAVTLISDRPEMFIYPTSIWMVTGEHRRGDDVIDLSVAADRFGFSFAQGCVTEVLPEEKAAIVDGTKMSADFLVLAAGANRFQIPGMSYTHTVWGTPDDTEALHDRLEALMEQGSGRIAFGFGGNPKDGSAVRGGPLFEVIFNVDHLLRKRKKRDAFELTFFAPMPKPGVRMGEKAADAVKTMLSRIGVHQKVGQKIVRFDEAGTVFADESRLDADLTVFIPAGAGHASVRGSGLPLNDAGFVIVDGQCRVPGFDGVYAVGDIASIEGPEWRAKQGHLTVIMAKIAAQSIRDAISHKETADDYRNHVSIVCVMDTGNGAAFVKRTKNSARLVYLPIVGHLLKKAWGLFYRLTHARVLPRLFRRARALPVSP